MKKTKRVLCAMLTVLLLAALLPLTASAAEVGFTGTVESYESFLFYQDTDDIVWDAYIITGSVPGMQLYVDHDCSVRLAGTPTIPGEYLVNVCIDTQRTGEITYLLYITIESIEVPTEAATEPAPVVSGTPTVTKHPYDEEVVVGDSTSFVAYANDVKQYVWELLTVDGGTISCSELAGVISGLGVSGYNTAELVLTNIPLTLDGCKVRCRFVGTEESVYSYYATITVTEKAKETTAPTQAATEATTETAPTEETKPAEETKAETNSSSKKSSKGDKKAGTSKADGTQEEGGSPVLVIVIIVAVVAAAAAAAFVILKKKGVFPKQAE